MILCHNHPSGTLVPSDADKQITKKLRTAEIA
jgi:DNA repair protein RadC